MVPIYVGPFIPNKKKLGHCGPNGMAQFQSFPKIRPFTPLTMCITQKIHGTNAQIRIYHDDNGNVQCQASSRTRNITPTDDNFGFAAFVEDNKTDIIEELGIGTHFGEWAGLKINSGEGLNERVFVLFDHLRHADKPLPRQMVLVPVLYQGPYSVDTINVTMWTLQELGSRLVPGFMRPEGIVIQIMDQRWKKVFEAEETHWKDAPPRTIMEGQPPSGYDASHMLQPIRLEKLQSRDERYSQPEMFKQLVTDYFQDLVDEQQLVGTATEIKAIKKAIWKQLCTFIKAAAK